MWVNLEQSSKYEGFSAPPPKDENSTLVTKVDIERVRKGIEEDVKVVQLSEEEWPPK